jgi:hypothetical protein
LAPGVRGDTRLGLLLKTATWAEINAFRELVATESAREPSLCAAAQRFARLFVEQFQSVVLSRVFAVVPCVRLPEAERELAARVSAQLGAAELLHPDTSVLSLLGTAGAEPSWNARALSAGHLAIPLLSKEIVQSIPMIAQLLADLKVDLAWLDDDRLIASRPMLGSSGQCFYVANAMEARDSRGRFIIPSQDFVTKYRVETVFGMAGSYLDGTLLVAITFTKEALDKLTVDRFPSIISNFRMATSALVMKGRVYES